MNRRTFLRKTSGLVLTALVAPTVGRAVAAARMDRIGMGTVLFRYRFHQTRPKVFEPPGGELTLYDIPVYYRDRFGIRNLEFWSQHFESLERPYLETLKAGIRAAGATLVNVQVDTSYNLASSNEEKRQQSLRHVKEWIDAVSFLGSTFIRINPGTGPVEQSIESLKEVSAYAKSRSLPLLTENHFGLEMDPDVHLRIIREVGPENVHSLPDFGNYSEAARFAALEKILPHARLVSAKAVDFNEKLEHISYDFDACVRLCERLGFKGIYSVEQWSRKDQNIDYEKVADWLIAHVRENI